MIMFSRSIFLVIFIAAATDLNARDKKFPDAAYIAYKDTNGNAVINDNGRFFKLGKDGIYRDDQGVVWGNNHYLAGEKVSSTNLTPQMIRFSGNFYILNSNGDYVMQDSDGDYIHYPGCVTSKAEDFFDVVPEKSLSNDNKQHSGVPIIRLNNNIYVLNFKHFVRVDPRISRFSGRAIDVQAKKSLWVRSLKIRKFCNKLLPQKIKNIIEEKEQSRVAQARQKYADDLVSEHELRALRAEMCEVFNRNEQKRERGLLEKTVAKVVGIGIAAYAMLRPQ